MRRRRILAAICDTMNAPLERRILARRRKRLRTALTVRYSMSARRRGSPAALGPLAGAQCDAAPGSTNISLGSRAAHTRAFNGQIPGPTIRVIAGAIVRARVINNLPAALTVHWHRITTRDDMDGVPDRTPKEIAPVVSFVYRFTHRSATAPCDPAPALSHGREGRRCPSATRSCGYPSWQPSG